jgi:hypothetical protein
MPSLLPPLANETQQKARLPLLLFTVGLALSMVYGWDWRQRALVLTALEPSVDYNLQLDLQRLQQEQKPLPTGEALARLRSSIRQELRAEDQKALEEAQALTAVGLILTVLGAARLLHLKRKPPQMPS